MPSAARKCGVSRHRTGPSIRSLARSLGTGPSIQRLRRHSGRTDGGEAPAQTERIVRVYGPVAPAGRTTNSTVTLLPSLKLSVTGTRSPTASEIGRAHV